MRVNGVTYRTGRDESGVLRFEPNNLLLKMHIVFETKTSKIIMLYELGAISLRDLFDYYAGIGFMVDRVKELSFFEQYTFEELP